VEEIAVAAAGLVVERYKTVETICNYNLAESLYRRLQLQCEAHLVRVAAKLAEDCRALNEASAACYLRIVSEAWSTHCEVMGLIQCIFLYLDRTYVLNTTGLESLWGMALVLFRDKVLRSDKVLARTVDGLLTVIGCERQGEKVSREEVALLLRMLAELNLYQESFQVPFLTQTTVFYEREGHTFFSQCEIPDYLL
jgi:cullin-4